MGEIGYRSSADSNDKIRLKLHSCQQNMRKEILEGLPVACVDQNPGIDEQFDKLVEELESTPVGKQDAASFLIMNPFDSSLTREEMFIVDSGAEMTYLRAQTAIDLKLGKSISFTTKYIHWFLDT